jgi:hypothetical protein
MSFALISTIPSISQLTVELYDFYLGAKAEVLLQTGQMLVIGIFAIGFSYLLRFVLRRLSSLVFLLGCACVLFGIYGLRTLGSGDYGRDSVTTISALGEQLEYSSTMSISFQQTFGGNGSIFLSAPTDPAHRYVALNRLGHSTLSPEALVTKISTDLNAVFPILATGSNGQEVKIPNQYMLGYIFQNPVEVTETGDHWFALTAEPGHALQGTAVHGVVQDASNDLWLFQYGFGPMNEKESGLSKTLTYPAANFMWSHMAANVRNAFQSYLSGTDSSR